MQIYVLINVLISYFIYNRNKLVVYTQNDGNESNAHEIYIFIAGGNRADYRCPEQRAAL